MSGRNFTASNAKDFRYGFQNQEEDDEIKGEGNSLNFAYRMQDPRLGRFFAIDPLYSQYPDNSPYAFSENRVTNGIDLEGLEYFYTSDGRLLGQIGKSDKVYVVTNADDVKQVEQKIKWANHQIENKLPYAKRCTDFCVNKASDLGVTQKELIAFAAVINLESSGAKEESYAIGNVTMNFLDEGGSKELKTLTDVTMYDNTFAQGATQENYTQFIKKTPEQQNTKYAVGAAINAINYSNNVSGYKDYSGGANCWDGLDLIFTNYKNSHRNYIWSNDSKTLLLKYQKDNKGGVDVTQWKYQEKGYEAKATKIIGKTLYYNLKGTKGSHKQHDKGKEPKKFE